MSIDEDEFEGMKIALSRLAKKTAALVKIAKEGNCAKPDYHGHGCELLENATRRVRRGGKRKSRKKRGKGAMMSSRKKISAREPKEKYVDEALAILIKKPEWMRRGVVVQVKMMRDLAFELEDADKQKKGGRRKRKSRKKRKKRKKRRKTKRRRR